MSPTGKCSQVEMFENNKSRRYTNPKKFWSFIKGKKQESSGGALLRHEGGTLHGISQTKADIFKTKFKSVFTKEVLSVMPDKGDNPYSPMEPINIAVEGVLKLLQNI